MNKGPVAVFGAILGLSIMSHAQAGVVSNVISPNKLAANKLAANKLAANKLAANKLAANKLAANKLAANKLAANKLAANGLDGAVDVRALAAQPLVKADQ